MRWPKIGKQKHDQSVQNQNTPAQFRRQVFLGCVPFAFFAHPSHFLLAAPILCAII
jgi:hypothetical protein